MPTRAKLRFPFMNEAGRNETETMWAVRRDDGYEIDNIPFYAKELALGDVGSTETDPDGVPWFKTLVRPSGHSTVRLWFSNPNDVVRIRDDLKRMGCASEVSDQPRLVAVDIPPGVPYPSVKAFLDKGERDGTFEYQEACLASR